MHGCGAALLRAVIPLRETDAVFVEHEGRAESDEEADGSDEMGVITLLSDERDGADEDDEDEVLPIPKTVIRGRVVVQGTLGSPRAMLREKLRQQRIRDEDKLRARESR